MITYVNTVLVSNLSTGAILIAEPKDYNNGTNYNQNKPSTDAGKFIIMNCDPNVAEGELYNVTAANAGAINKIKIGIVTKKNTATRVRKNGAIVTEYRPIIKWSNEIKSKDVRSFNFLSYEADSEDQIVIDFATAEDNVIKTFAEGGKRIVVRLTYKDMPHRYRKWTESYEYITPKEELTGNDAAATTANITAYKKQIASDIANAINLEWKRARVNVVTGTYTPGQAGAPGTFSTAANGGAIMIEALPYDDDDAVDTLNWANKVRFNANIYYTDPAGDGWESLNKYFPKGVAIVKTPGKTYPASAKLVRDRESQAMGYLGILNRGQGTWPIIKPDMEVQLDKHYDAITLEFENMYRAADDIFRKTKQTVEIYGITGQLGAAATPASTDPDSGDAIPAVDASGLYAILEAFIDWDGKLAD